MFLKNPSANFNKSYSLYKVNKKPLWGGAPYFTSTGYFSENNRKIYDVIDSLVKFFCEFSNIFLLLHKQVKIRDKIE